MGRVLRLSAATVLVALGIVGLVLPVLQGVLTLLVAAALLSPDVPPARRLLLSGMRRWPEARRKLPSWVRRLMRRHRRPFPCA